MRRILSAISVTCLVTASVGCQSWSQVGQGMPVGSRVPPPGTGTYNVPSSYYNGPKAGTASTAAPTSNTGVNSATGSTMGRTASMPQGQMANEVMPASYQLPTVDQLRTGINNAAGAMVNDVSNRANQAVQNGTARAASTIQQYTPPAFDNAPPAFAAPAPGSVPGTSSQSISDAPSTAATAGPPKLDWQAPR